MLEIGMVIGVIVVIFSAVVHEYIYKREEEKAREVRDSFWEKYKGNPDSYSREVFLRIDKNEIKREGNLYFVSNFREDDLGVKVDEKVVISRGDIAIDYDCKDHIILYYRELKNSVRNEAKREIGELGLIKKLGEEGHEINSNNLLDVTFLQKEDSVGV